MWYLTLDPRSDVYSVSFLSVVSEGFLVCESAAF